MVDTGLRGRVTRLLAGNFRADDLTRLFLYARDRCDGRESVQEIGDFVAHHNERSKGIVTQTLRDFFVIAQFQIPTLGQTIDGARLPSIFPEFLKAQAKRTTAQAFRQANIRRSDAHKLLPSIIKKLQHNADGTFALVPQHTNTEVALINCLCAHLTASPAFSLDRLFEDFSATLKSHGLLQRSEMRPFETLRPAIGLFAASLMHNCNIVLKDQSVSQLKINISDENDLTVLATVSVITAANPVLIAFPIFSTGLRPTACCDELLLAGGPSWSSDVEVNERGKLVALG